jgi:hypothetical protein
LSVINFQKPETDDDDGASFRDQDNHATRWRLTAATYSLSSPPAILDVIELVEQAPR